MSDLELLERPDKLVHAEKLAAEQTARNRRRQLKPIRKIQAANQLEEERQRADAKKRQRQAQRLKAARVQGQKLES